MGEWVRADIVIGGKITAEQADHIIDELKAHNWRLQDPRAHPSYDDTPSRDNLGGQFYGEANYGSFSELTDWLKAEHIPFDYSHDAGGDWAEGRIFSTGSECRTTALIDNEPVMLLKDIIATESLASGWAELIAKARWWRDAKLPPLEIVRETHAQTSL